jgi:hypothetical protein
VRALAGLALVALAGCGPSVDCALLCDRTLECQVTFDAPDDPDASRVASGERTEEESCVLGCEASPVVTVERALCIDDLEVGEPATCQEEVLACLELDEA